MLPLTGFNFGVALFLTKIGETWVFIRPKMEARRLLPHGFPSRGPEAIGFVRRLGGRRAGGAVEVPHQRFHGFVHRPL